MMARRTESNASVEQNVTSNFEQTENLSEIPISNQNARSNQAQSDNLRNRHGNSRAHHANRQTIQEIQQQQQEEEESIHLKLSYFKIKQI